VVTAATVVPRATGSTRKGLPTGGSPALLDVFEAGTGVVSGTLAASRAGTCRRRLAAANPDLEIARIELMHLAYAQTLKQGFQQSNKIGTSEVPCC
jgi:hypothetical protein